MKNLFKIATISALVALSANAMAEDANQDFTWTGTVPAADAGTGIKIKDLTSGTTFDAGAFTLTKTAEHSSPEVGYFEIASANTLSFDVVTDDANEDHVDYYYTMTNISFKRGEIGTSPVMFKITPTANGLPLQLDVKSAAASAPTDLTLTSGTGPYYYGQQYSYQVTMLITDQAI
ncbi:hypothetical protein Sps_03958 [Shewanella psychrophila]|uniref:CS1 type fimbrial major subunit n=1 Tax=Shewanella psychrophila TaxID=225848 RepID=A0A1S6HU48_9GAMM|nr:hypothetical protein [Shewanella psychrophila]AQS39073.1 hypothetical protein Sps_03958 [Shewanella psychrophila]